MNPRYRSWLQLAYQVARESPDLSTQNGAVLVDPINDCAIASTLACNRFPVGVTVTDERLARPQKYLYTEHSERGALYAAARQDVCTDGLWMVAAWAACADCARAIACAGIHTLVRHAMPDDEAGARWRDSIVVGDTILAEAGVHIVEVKGHLGVASILRDGKVFQP